ncbi:MAG TPA: Crp/Fnr family transcriptional regulator [Pyrinomonadaceae bacterium]|nr:Crp/Fnr family transcriptional regulator [Pyrinomonadaceae bacterium]
MEPQIQVQSSKKTNKILSALSAADYARIAPNLKLIHLAQGEKLYSTGEGCKWSWFLLDGLLSVAAETEEGETMDVGMIGTEGAAGMLAAFHDWQAPFTATVEIRGQAMRISAVALKEEINRLSELQVALLKYTAFLYHQIARSVLCGRFHQTERRLCRFLLTISDRIGSPIIPLKHERLSHLIGAHRPRVTGTLNKLAAQKLLQLTRGKIVILDRAELETHACSCYTIIDDAMTRYLAHLSQRPNQMSTRKSVGPPS